MSGLTIESLKEENRRFYAKNCAGEEAVGKDLEIFN